MNLFSRLRTVTLAYSNNLLDRAVDMNSLPVVRQFIRDLEDAIDKTNHESAVAAANVSVLQSQIDGSTKTVALDTQRAQAYLAKNDETNARLVASRIHDGQVFLDSLKEQISQATSNSQQLDSALAKMKSKHTEVMNQLRVLESKDRQADALHSATSSLKSASSILSSNDVSDSVDSIGRKIDQKAAVENEEFSRAVGAFDTPPDPLKDEAVDDILNSLRPKEAGGGIMKSNPGENEMDEVIEFDVFSAGIHISEVCRKVSVVAKSHSKPVHFVFNDIHVTAQPGESEEALQARWQADMESAAKTYREHPDRIKEAEERERKDKEAREAHIKDDSKDEKEMREADVPWPKTKEQLAEYIESLVIRDHDYGTCVYAMSMAAVAAFNYVAGQVGATGFQSSMADMDVIRRTRMLKGPFMLINGEDALYPQYDLPARLEENMEKWKPWLKEEAVKKLTERGSANSSVIEHWLKLASYEVELEPA
jgi:phage shock protein A